jgi:DMSO/TMAO reductase YedYZ molybdopterin-dependent catalytic subunit
MNTTKRSAPVKVDGDAVLKEAVKRLSRRMEQPARRALLQRSLTLGGLALLSGCSLTDSDSVETVLASISRLNDRAQAALFDPTRLAPTHPDSMITRPIHFNAYCGEDEIREIDGDAWRLEFTGLVADKRSPEYLRAAHCGAEPLRAAGRGSWTLADLRAMPQQQQVTRHIGVEGWRAVGQWGGVPFSHLLKRVGADLSARSVGFKCADDYQTSIDMATAQRPQTTLALNCDGQVLSPKYGFPAR